MTAGVPPADRLAEFRRFLSFARTTARSIVHHELKDYYWISRSIYLVDYRMIAKSICVYRVCICRVSLIF